MGGAQRTGQRTVDAAQLMDRIPEMVVVIASDLTISFVNQRLLDTMGYHRDEVIGSNIFDFAHPDDHEYLASTWALRAANPGETGMFIQARGRNADGSWRACEILGLSLLDDGVIDGMVMTLRDLTLKRDRGDTSARFRSMLDRTSDVVLVLGEDGRIVYANRRLTSNHGVDQDEVVGTSFVALLPASERATFDDWFSSLVADGGRSSGQIRLLSSEKDGDSPGRTIEWHGTNHIDDPLIEGVILSGRDVTGLVEMERRLQSQADELRHAAGHDGLTGLLNRAAFISAVTAEVEARRAADPAGEAVVFFCDLDRFKNVNDAYGHAAGDQVLRASAARLRGCLREVDLVARWGGDEFTVLLRDAPSSAEIEALVERIRVRLGTPVSVGGTTTVVGVTIGVSRAPLVGLDVDALLRTADEQMYARKPRR